MTEHKPGDPADKGADARAEIDRLRNELKTETETVQHLIGERTADRKHWGAIEHSLDRAERILAALREASEALIADARKQYGYDQYTVGSGIMAKFRAAVAAAEQKVGP